jgi:hypothetical protein
LRQGDPPHSFCKSDSAVVLVDVLVVETELVVLSLVVERVLVLSVDEADVEVVSTTDQPETVMALLV